MNHKKKIGIDYRVFQSGYANKGVGNYLHHLLSFFVSQTSSLYEFSFFLFANEPIHDHGFLESLQGKIRCYYIKKAKRFDWFWENVRLPLLIYKAKLDLYLATVCLGPIRSIELPFFQPVCTVGIVFDLNIINCTYDPLSQVYRKMKSYRIQMRSIKRCPKIITISEYVKQDLVNKFNLLSHQIEVIYPETNRFIYKESIPFNKIKFYIIMIGESPNKNISTGIKAFNKAKKYLPELEMVIVGKKEKILKQMTDHEPLQGIFFNDSVDSEQMRALYNNAQMLMYLSLDEGFGLPILEAMVCGCPVIASNRLCLKEAAGNATIQVNPFSVDEIAKAIREIIYNPQLRERLIRLGFERVRYFRESGSKGKMVSIVSSLIQ